jgi:GT2 family glycosyltransferase
LDRLTRTRSRRNTFSDEDATSDVKTTLILCTRNRAPDVERLFESFAGLSRLPDCLLVVDSGSGTETQGLVKGFSQLNRVVDVRWIPSEPGLTRQRMLGLDNLDPDVDLVHFVDDDVVLEPDYFKAIEQEFVRRPDALGVGGRIANLPRHKPRLDHRVLLRDSVKEGVVLPSGVNILVFGGAAPCDVQWLSGCSMSFRRSVFDRLSFDTRMSGYSHGEDVDFTFRVAQLGALVSTPHARLQHLCSPVNRYDADRWEISVLTSRHRFVCEMRGFGVNRSAYWWCVGGQAIVSVGRWLLRRPGGRERLVLTARAIREILLGGRVRANPRLGCEWKTVTREAYPPPP